MIHKRISLLAAITVLAAALMLGGCGNNEPGYVNQGPPESGPQQSADVPPGERAKTKSPDAPGGGH